MLHDQTRLQRLETAMLFKEVTAVCIAGAFSFGMIMVMLASIRPALAKRLNLSEGTGDWLMATFHLALIPMMLLGGLAVDRIGPQLVTVAGSVISCAALVMLARSEGYLRSQGAILLLGAGGALLSTSSIVLMRQAFFENANEAASQNMGNVFFGIGALVAPPLTEALLGRLNYRQALISLAIVVLVPAVAAALTAREAFEQDSEPGALADLLSSPILWVAGLVFLLYGPLEGSLGFWATRYLTSVGFREKTAEWLLTAFWLSFLCARLLAAFLQRNGIPRFPPQAWIIIALAIGAAAALGNMWGARTRTSALAGLLVVGACLGPIFPTLVGILLDNFKLERGTAYGAMFSIGAAGSFFLPPLMGVFARRSTLQRAMRIPMAIALLLALAALVLGLLS